MKSAEQSVEAHPSTSRLTNIFNKFKMVSGPVYISVMLFGMSTWIAVVGVWIEMPLLVNALPESWNLPSYLVIIIQCANLGPAMYAIWDKIRQRNQQARDEHHQDEYPQQQQQSRIDREVVMSLIIILTAILSMLLLSLFWDHTVVIASVNRSVALLTLVSFASLACCTSSVVFLPYMARFPSVYISAYYFGQGLCGLLPGLLGLAQVVGQEPQCRNETDINDTTVTVSTSDVTLTPGYTVYYSSPRFSVGAMFALITVLLCVSAVAFCCLNFVDKCRSKLLDAAVDDSQPVNADEATAARDASMQEATGLLESRENSKSNSTPSDSIEIQTPVRVVIQRRRYASLLVTIGIISALWNGILPATQTYTCLPYGNIVYRLSVCLSWVVSPLATLPNMLAPTSSLPLIVGLGAAASVLSALHLLLAAQSPHPILQGTVIGQVIVVSRQLCHTHYCEIFGSRDILVTKTNTSLCSLN